MGTPGGLMFSRQVASHLDLTPPYPADAPLITRYSRVSGVPATLGLFPAGTLAEEIDTPGEGRTRGLITVAANPVLSAPGSGRLERALPLLDFMISFDSYINETTCHADVILPGPSPLEQAHWDAWAWPWCLTSGGHYSPPLFRPDRMEEWRVVMTVAGLLRGTPLNEIDTGAMDDAHFAAMCRRLNFDPERIAALAPDHGPERILDLAIRGGKFGDRYGEREGLTLGDFKAQPHGILTGIAPPGVPIHRASGKIDIAPAYLLADLPRLRAAMAEPRPQTYLVSRRTLRSMNSWMNNVPVLAKGPERCTLLIHPDDAGRIAVRDDDLVAVTNGDNRIVVPAEITPHIKPGVVSMPHGWGHDRPGARLRVARERPGVNVNSLNPADLLDTASGNAVVNGVPVAIEKFIADRP
jgi:anaerobic selenocysteine-containing dehydrogenase